MVVGNRWAAAVGLTDGDFERQTGDSEEEECDEVWDLCGGVGQYGSSTAIGSLLVHYLRTTEAQSCCKLVMAN